MSFKLKAIPRIRDWLHGHCLGIARAIGYVFWREERDLKPDIRAKGMGILVSLANAPKKVRCDGD